MEFQPASPEQIDVFLKAAMARYAEKGIPEDKAQELLASSLAKVAEELGMNQPQEKTAEQSVGLILDKCIEKRASRNRIEKYKTNARAAISEHK